MITDKQIADLLPHTAPMLMITELVNYSSDAIHCRCTLAADNPLLQDERLPALAGLELLAQGAGLLLGLNRTEGKPGGAVAALSRCAITDCAATVGDTIDVHARLLGRSADAAMFEGETRAAERTFFTAAITLVTSTGDAA
ncbi:MAG: hypothetical protein KDJ27_19410 [Gammaproteobacteria bacterium]|nr:hypothetical protein [Gammaproteobacteria bacterium]